MKEKNFDQIKSSFDDLTEQMQTRNLEMLSNQAEIQALIDKNTRLEQINKHLSSEKNDYFKKRELEMQKSQNQFNKRLEEKDLLIEKIRSELHNSKLDKNFRTEQLESELNDAKNNLSEKNKELCNNKIQELNDILTEKKLELNMKEKNFDQIKSAEFETLFERNNNSYLATKTIDFAHKKIF